MFLALLLEGRFPVQVVFPLIWGIWAAYREDDHCQEGGFLWLPDQLHLRLLWGTGTLLEVAPQAGRGDVRPRRLAPLSPGNDMVEGEFLDSVFQNIGALATVLTGVAPYDVVAEIGRAHV